MINKSVPLACFVLMLTLLGCTGGDSDSSPSEFSGLWYQADRDFYMNVSDSGGITIYYCTLNDGYVHRPELGGSVSDKQLIITEEGILIDDLPSDIGIENSELVETVHHYDETMTIIRYSKAKEMSDYCESSAIEITSVTPLEVYEGVSTIFSISFNYRLALSGTANIYMSFPYADSHIRIAVDDVSEVTHGVGSGVIVGELVPTPPENERRYSVRLSMTGEDRISRWDQVFIELIAEQ